MDTQILEELKSESYEDFMLSQIKSNWAGILLSNIERLKTEYQKQSEMVQAHQLSFNKYAAKYDKALEKRHEFEARHIADLKQIKGGLNPKFQKEITKYFAIIRELNEAGGMRDQQSYFLQTRTPELKRLKFKIEKLEELKDTPVDQIENEIFLKFVR